MSPKVSVIVPVYKVEKYLDRCVQSLLNQTMKDIEIILVDDGSPDHCGRLCDAYVRMDPRVRVIHKRNGGLSSARNAGMEAAVGEFVGFVDSDDTVEPVMYEKLASTAEDHQVDFVMADYLRILQDGTKLVKTLDIEGGFYNRDKIKKEIFPNLIMRDSVDYGPLLSVCHCLYRRSFLVENSLCFDEEVRWSEDNIFSAIMGYCCRSFYYLKGEALYHYFQNEGSITTTYRNGAWDVYSLMNRHLHDYFDLVEDYDFSRQLKLHIIYYACNSIGQELSLQRQEAMKGIRRILYSQQLTGAFQDFKIPKVSIKLKIQLYLMKWKQARLLYMLKKR